MEEINITNHSPFAKVNHFAQCWVKDRMYLDEIEELMQDALTDVHKWLKAHPVIAPEDIIGGCGRFHYETKKDEISSEAILEYAEKHHLPMPKIRKMIQSLERSSPKLVWKVE